MTEPLFSVPAGSERCRVPLGAPASWLAAVEAADWQCQQTAGETERRCEHRGRGPAAWRLYVIDDGAGPVVLCEPCAKRRNTRSAPAASVIAEPLF